MDTTPSDGAVIKTDVLGRVKMSVERREQLLDEFERSGLSGCKYAELIGVKYSTFATWAQKRRRASGGYKKLTAKAVVKAEPVRWLEAVVQEAKQTTGGPLAEAIVLEMRGGGRVQISHAKQVVLAAALLRELEKPC